MKKFILAFMMTMGLSASYKVIGSSKLPAVVYSAIPNNPTMLVFMVLGLYFFLTYKDNISLKTNWLQKILSLFFSYCTWSVIIYHSGNSSINAIITNHPIGILFSLLTLMSYFILLDSIQGMLSYYFEKPRNISLKNNFLRKVVDLFSRNVFLSAFIILFSIWFLIGLSAYPGVFMGDSLDQVEQFFGYQTRTAAHPVLSTVFLGSFVKLGSVIGSPNIGLFMYTVAQILILSLLISFSIKLIYEVTQESGKLLFVTVLLALLPSVNGVIILATKDIIFSGFFVLYLTTLAIYFLENDYFYQNKLYVFHSLSILLMMLYRYNTLHFILLSLVVYLASEIISKKKILRKKSLILLTLASLFVASGVNKLLIASFSEKDPTPQWEAMLSLPFQHTARYVVYHDDEISKKDKEVINNVMKYDELKKAYNPVLSDPVKRTFRKEATVEERSDYFNLVGRQIRSHPLLALETLTAMHGNLFSVNQPVNWYYDNTVILDGERKGMMDRYEKIGLSDNQLFLTFNDVRMFWYFLWDRLPIFSHLNNYGVYIFLMLSMFALSLKKRKYELTAMFIPMGAYIGTLLAGPITQGYLRFELPIFLFVPLSIILFFSTTQKSSEIKINEKTYT